MLFLHMSLFTPWAALASFGDCSIRLKRQALLYAKIVIGPKFSHRLRLYRASSFARLTELHRIFIFYHHVSPLLLLLFDQFVHLLHISLGDLICLLAEYREPGAQHKVPNEATNSTAHVNYRCTG